MPPPASTTNIVSFVYNVWVLRLVGTWIWSLQLIRYVGSNFGIPCTPHPLRGIERGLVLFERFLGLADIAFLNSGAPIRNTLCNHNIMWYCSKHYFPVQRTWSLIARLLGNTNFHVAIIWDVSWPSTSQSPLKSTRPFSLAEGGSGNETTFYVAGTTVSVLREMSSFWGASL